MNYYSTDETTIDTMSPSIPREVIIRKPEQQPESSLSSSSSTEHHSNGSSLSITPSEWLSSSHQETKQQQGPPSPLTCTIQGCAVSLSSSSNCSSQDCSSLIQTIIEEDPLDFRMDWSEELENDLKSCIKHNPELFLIADDRHYYTSDSNSLCSQLSEEYEMEDSDIVMTAGIWDDRQEQGQGQHDISIPACVSSR